MLLLPFCEEGGIQDVSGLDNRLLDRLTSRLLGRGGPRGPLSKQSVHAYARAVNHFLAWARREGESVEGRAHLPRLPRPVIDVLSRDEIQRLEDMARSERDKLIARTLADTGLRVGELVKLRLTDLVSRGRQHHLRVRGKGSKERLVPIPPSMSACVATPIAA